ncbi:hypothetical protein [Paenibacillus yonginensis]|uniref:hypothetical protein n=1 Tax=Paenibacillus yonginensis TaxID=1462996 RepID=UPI000A867DB6|nr:hypothetical protein [Paenibacillus yonginensis]
MKKIQITATALGLTLLVGSVPPAMAATGSTQTSKASTSKAASTPVIHTINNLPSVKLTSKSYIRLTDINTLSQDDSNLITYTLTVTNGDTKSLNLLDYWTKVKTVSGTVYNPTLITADKEKKTVAPGSSVTLTYSVKVAKHIKPTSLIFDIVKWDFSQANYERKLGQFKIPEGYLLSTPAAYSKTLRINEAPVKLKVNNATSFLSGSYNYVGVDLNVQNIGYRLFEDPKLKFVIKTASGSNYPLTADASSTGYSIQPQDSQTLKLMASIPKSVSLKNLELQVIQDDETAKTSLPIATMQLAAVKNETIAVQPNAEKTIDLTNGKLAASVTGAWVNQSYGKSDLSIQFLLRNSGVQTVSVPKYGFELHTSNGYTLPITTSALDNVTLAPQESRSIKLNITVDSSVITDGLQLFVNAPGAAQQTPSDSTGTGTGAGTSSAASFNYPVGIFQLPEAVQLQNTLGTEQFMQTNNGLVGLTLSSIQRLPWSDGDLVSAKITIANHANKTITLPDLTGQFKVDSAQLANDVKLVSTSASGLLGADQSTNVYVVSKLPASLDVSQLQVALMEKIGESSSEWFRFTHLGEMPSLPEVDKGKSYKLDNQGRQEEIKEVRSVVYTGDSNDIMYTELEVKNLEKYQLDLSQLVGYFETSSGQSYQAQAVQVDTPAPSLQSGLVVLWTKLPKGIYTQDMKLVVGEGIADNKLTPLKGESTGYINAAEMALNVQTPGTNSTLSGMVINPYALSITDVAATLTGSSSVQVGLTYSLTRSNAYIMGEFGHKYVLEMKDSLGRIFTKELTPETDLKTGSGNTLSFSNSDSVYEGLKGGNFTLTVYDEFQGARIPLASQGFYYIYNGDTSAR